MPFLKKLKDSYRQYHAILGQFEACQDYMAFLQEQADHSHGNGNSPAPLHQQKLQDLIARMQAHLPSRRHVRLFILLKVSRWPLQQAERNFIEAVEGRLAVCLQCQKEAARLIHPAPALASPPPSPQASQASLETIL